MRKTKQNPQFQGVGSLQRSETQAYTVVQKHEREHSEIPRDFMVVKVPRKSKRYDPTAKDIEYDDIFREEESTRVLRTR